MLSSAVAAPWLAAAAPLRARLCPGAASQLGFSPLPGERLAFAASGVAGTIVVPVARAGLLGTVPVGDRELALITFATDPASPAGSLDYAAIIGWDGTALRLMALELRTWQAEAQPRFPFGARLTTRFSATADRASLLLQRDAAAPRRNGSVQRESWTDRLEWRGDASLADAPPRPPPPGTWQRRMADDRAQLAAQLVSPRDIVTPALLALCRPPDLTVT